MLVVYQIPMGFTMEGMKNKVYLSSILLYMLKGGQKWEKRGKMQGGFGKSAPNRGTRNSMEGKPERETGAERSKGRRVVRRERKDE